MARGLPKSYIKKYGITKRAWAEYRKSSGSTRRRSKTSSKRSGSTTAKRRRSSRRSKRRGGGRRPFGTVGWKGMLAGLVSLAFLRILIRRMFGAVPAEYVDSASLVGAGVIGKVAKIGTANLLTPGIVLGGSKVIEDIFTPGGYYTIGGNAGGYDY